MRAEKNRKHPIFILGLLSYVLLLTGVVALAADPAIGRPLILAAFAAGGIHWIGSMITIYRDRTLTDDTSRHFWLALTIMVPPVGGMLYYLVDGRKFSF